VGPVGRTRRPREVRGRAQRNPRNSRTWRLDSCIKRGCSRQGTKGFKTLAARRFSGHRYRPQWREAERERERGVAAATISSKRCRSYFGEGKIGVHWRVRIVWVCAIWCVHHQRQPDFSPVLGGAADSPLAAVVRLRFIIPVWELPSRFTLVPTVLIVVTVEARAPELWNRESPELRRGGCAPPVPGRCALARGGKGFSR
jgi:hypothetical protein